MPFIPTRPSQGVSRHSASPRRWWLGRGGRCVRGVSPRLHNRTEIWKLSLRLETKRHRNGRSSSGLGNGGRKLGSSPPVARVGPTTWGDVRRMRIVAGETMFSRAFGLRSCQWRSQETPNHSARPLHGSPTMPWILHVNRATRPSWARYLSLRRLPARTFILRIAQTPYRVSCVTPSETGMDTPSYDDKSSLTSEIF